MSEIIVTKKRFGKVPQKNRACQAAARQEPAANQAAARRKKNFRIETASFGSSKEGLFDALLFISLSAFAVLLVASGRCAEFTLKGIKLWAAMVLPSLLPYFFISAALAKLKTPESLSKLFSPLFKKVFAVSGIVSYAFFISVISGCPVGAKTVSDLKENGFITEDEGVRASVLCSVLSPSFIISGIGSAFGSVRFSFALFCCHILSDICTGVMFSFYKRPPKKACLGKERAENPRGFNEKPLEKQEKRGGAGNFLYECAYNSVVSVLVVGGLITLFSVISSVLELYGLLSPALSAVKEITGSRELSEGIVFGALECTSGVAKLSSLGACKQSFVAAAAICGFGGVSATAQSLAYLKKAKIKAAPFVLSRFAAAALNCLFALIVYGVCF